MKKSKRLKAQLPPAPPGFTDEARQLWEAVASGWVLEPPALKILDGLCRDLMQARRLEKILHREGEIVLDRFGQKREHPAACLLDKAKRRFLLHQRALGLDLEPLHAGAGRPPGGGPV